MISTYPRFYFWVQLLFLGPAFNMGPTFILWSYFYFWVLHSFSSPTSILRPYLICGPTLILAVPSFIFGSYNSRQDPFLWKSPTFNYNFGPTLFLLLCLGPTNQDRIPEESYLYNFEYHVYKNGWSYSRDPNTRGGLNKWEWSKFVNVNKRGSE